jgi:hypothetical protein
LANGTAAAAGPQKLTIPTAIAPDKLYLGGSWGLNPEYAEASSSASITLSYHSKNVYIVASADGTAPAVVEILIDGVHSSTVSIDGNKVYTLVKGASWGAHRIDLIIKSGTLRAYTFTFG